MTTLPKLTFADYLALDPTGDTAPAELIDGVLVTLPPESGRNTEIAAIWFAALLASGVSVLHLKLGNCELQTPVLTAGDAANRFPDLVVIREEHRSLTQQRMTITLEMPPPRFVVEVVSPGEANRQRDYVRKRAQYAAIAIPEYIIADPETQTVTVLLLDQGHYVEHGCYQGNQSILSPSFPRLTLTPQSCSPIRCLARHEAPTSSRRCLPTGAIAHPCDFPQQLPDPTRSWANGDQVSLSSC